MANQMFLEKMGENRQKRYDREWGMPLKRLNGQHSNKRTDLTDNCWYDWVKRQSWEIISQTHMALC
jgi:hypothetical protein